MATIVKNKRTDKKYILLGTGLGVFKAIRPSFLGGNLIPHEEEGRVTEVAVCDYKGNIIWISSDDIQVLEVDGVSISDISIFECDREAEIVARETEQLEKIQNYKLNCPVCGRETESTEKYCYGCGFNFLENEE